MGTLNIWINEFLVSSIEPGTKLRLNKKFVSGMIMLLTLQLDIFSQSLISDLTVLSSSFLMPQRGVALLNRNNYNNGGEVHKSFTTSSNASAILMEENQLYKMTAKWYLGLILL